MKRPTPATPPWAAIPAVALLLAHALLFRFAVDDAYISFRYARNLLAGHGLVFNPGEPVEGYSNLLWVPLSAAGQALGLDPLWWARLLGFAAAAATALLLPGLALRLAAGAGGPAPRVTPAPSAAPLAGVAVWLAAVCGPLACWSLAGLETPLFGLLLLLAWRAALDRRAITAGLCALLLALTRPEGAALGLAFAAWAGLAPAGGRRRWLAPAIVSAGVAAHLLWRHAFYGDWLPNTWYAKTGDLGGQLRTGLPYTAAFLPAFLLPWALLPLAAPGGWTRVWRTVEWRRSLLLLSGWLLYVTAIGGDMLGMFRFFVPILPVGIACGTAVLVSAPVPSPRRIFALVALLAAASLVPTFAGRERRLVDAHLSLRNLGGWETRRRGTGAHPAAGCHHRPFAGGLHPRRTGFVTYDILSA